MAASIQSDVVIREAVKDVWTFSCPFDLKGVPIGARSTAIKLTDGSLWVLASTPLTQDTKSKLAELGDVRYIVSPARYHHFYLKEFKDEYPNAKLIGVKDLNDVKRLEGWQLDEVFDGSNPDEQYGFESEIGHCYFSGSKMHDVAFYHKASKTVFGGDLLFNLPCNEQYLKSDISPHIPIITSMLQPETLFCRLFIWLTEGDYRAMARDARRVADWDFDRFIPCHGDVIESGAKQLWKSTYRRYF
ncbi:hypothetical protein C8Q75DRAFT_806455 [Abortiporus biennis]|nr:hypothetical protein C8Q75DRAFT_806455 [Abortiporus biennis]